MSADNWDICPVCYERALVSATGPVDEHDYQTFREDYEFYLQDKVVNVYYSGRCTVCGSGIVFKDQRPIETKLS